MAITQAQKAKRFFNAGITKVVFLPVVAAFALDTKNAGYGKPTAAELGAGIDLTADINDFAGWNVTSNYIDTPDLGTRYTSRIPGRTTSEDSSITFYASQDAKDMRVTLPRGTSGAILINDAGDVGSATAIADVFSVQVGSVGKTRSISDSAMVLAIGFAILAQPAEDVVLPASA